MATVVERVDRLEEAIEAFVTNVGIEFNKLYNSQMRTEAELRAFKDEVRRQGREMNRKWGELANKLGTIVEDLVAPSLPRIIEVRFGGTVTDLMPRRKRRLGDGRVKEFDAVVLTKDADIGDIVTPIGAAAEAKAAVVTIADMESLQVEVDVSESSITRVEVGQPCEIHLDALNDQRFPGTVHMIVPTADRTKATVMVKVAFQDKDPRILPEMRAKVAFLSRPVLPGETAAVEVRLQDSGTVAGRILRPDGATPAHGAEVILHPTQKHAQAVSFTYDRKRWLALDPAIQPDLDYLRGLSPGELFLLSRTLDDRFWAVAYELDDSPLQFYLYDRQARQAAFLFTNRSALEGAPLARMRSFIIEARDGVKLVGYYTLPLGCDADDDGIPDQPLPMVFVPHGGPWGRDTWGLDVFHQWLANRGYVVMCVNFRSSTGFGKRFTNLGDKAWGTGIIADQYDTVQWAIRQRIADPDQVAIMGGSFGGYSTLAGLVFYPDTYACGVDIVGPSNLITLLESMPEYWKPMLDMFTMRVGDHRTEEGRALLTAHSPLTHAANLRKPLLIAQGANDPRVKRAEADQIVQALQDKGIPVAYVLYPDEGHGFARPENNLSFTAITEAFLARCLEGRYEPVGDDFQGSSLQVLAGAAEVPGLEQALQGD